jgi:hypothetical protein
MNEKEIRERIERFLKKTARNVVVPASVGLGLSLSGCDNNALHASAADAGRDVAAQSPDGADAALGPDLPISTLPYLVFLPPPDAALETTASLPDAELDATPMDATPIDLRAEMPAPPPPYLIVLPDVDNPTLGPAAPLPLPPAKTR